MDTNDLFYLYCTLVGEARGESVEGIVAVANVIKNRAYSAQKTYKEICLAPLQFSCWNPDDPNYAMISTLLSDVVSGNNPVDITLRQCLAVAKAVYEGDFKDNVKGAKNYVTLKRYSIAQARQDVKLDSWINKMKPIVTYGNHIFLGLICVFVGQIRKISTSLIFSTKKMALNSMLRNLEQIIVAEDDAGIIAVGTLVRNLEVTFVTVKSRSRKSRVLALTALVDQVDIETKNLKYDQVHAFVTNESILRILKDKFNFVKTKAIQVLIRFANKD
jgi:N-acetylmuramoyl-L-alanine amidase